MQSHAQRPLAPRKLSEELKNISHIGTMLEAGRMLMLPYGHSDRFQRSFIHSTNTNGGPGPIRPWIL